MAITILCKVPLKESHKFATLTGTKESLKRVCNIVTSRLVHRKTNREPDL